MKPVFVRCMAGKDDSMEMFLLSILGLVLFIWVCKKLSRLSYRVADHLDREVRYKKKHEKELLDSIRQIRDSVAKAEVEDTIGLKERLLLANLKIQERKTLKTAMEDELGIK